MRKKFKVGNPEQKRPLCLVRWEDNIKMCLAEVGLGLSGLYLCGSE
jgi:hypothetical protein